MHSFSVITLDILNNGYIFDFKRSFLQVHLIVQLYMTTAWRLTMPVFGCVHLFQVRQTFTMTLYLNIYICLKNHMTTFHSNVCLKNHWTLKFHMNILVCLKTTERDASRDTSVQHFNGQLSHSHILESDYTSTALRLWKPLNVELSTTQVTRTSAVMRLWKPLNFNLNFHMFLFLEIKNFHFGTCWAHVTWTANVFDAICTSFNFKQNRRESLSHGPMLKIANVHHGLM